MGVEPTSSAWKADVLAVVRHLRTGCELYYNTASADFQARFLFFRPARPRLVHKPPAGQKRLHNRDCFRLKNRTFLQF